jgi:hypothetical protein
MNKNNSDQIETSTKLTISHLKNRYFQTKLFFINFPLGIIKMNLYLQPLWRGTLAQLVEQRTENPCVPGSIPGGTT